MIDAKSLPKIVVFSAYMRMHDATLVEFYITLCYYSIIYAKMQNLTEKNENGAQKSACFYFFRSIF